MFILEKAQLWVGLLSEYSTVIKCQIALLDYSWQTLYLLLKISKLGEVPALHSYKSSTVDSK